MTMHRLDDNMTEPMYGIAGAKLEETILEYSWSSLNVKLMPLKFFKAMEGRNEYHRLRHTIQQ
jgi:hypothetical protein